MRCTIFELLFIADIATSFIFHFYTFSHEGQCFDIFPFCYSFFRYFSLSTFFLSTFFPFDIFPFRHFSFDIFTLFFLSFDIFPFDISTTHLPIMLFCLYFSVFKRRLKMNRHDLLFFLRIYFSLILSIKF